MIYQLTQQHIEDGRPAESDECAVALCLEEAGLGECERHGHSREHVE